MTIYNTGSDSANTNVRAFLTKIGEYYLGRRFDTSNGQGKADWTRIKESVFNSKCAYCDMELERPTIEHLIMFNRRECGLHHPGNIVPCCRECNKRKKTEDGEYQSWQNHLFTICKESDTETYERRKEKIEKHIENENYPKLTEDEINSLKAICIHLYDATKLELDKSLELYKNIDKTLVNRR